MSVTLRAILAAIVLLSLAFSAQAARKTPSSRISGATLGAGTHTASLNVPSGTTQVFVEACYFNDAGGELPTGVTLDGQPATVVDKANASPQAFGLVLWRFAGVTTGSGKVLSYTLGSTGNWFSLDFAAEYRDGTATYAVHDAAQTPGAPPVTATTSALANANGNEILSAYCVNRDAGAGSPTVGSGQSKLDETDDGAQSFYGFTTETATGSSDAQSVTGRTVSIVSVVLGAAGPTIPSGSQGVILTSIAVGSVIDKFNASVSPDIAVGDYVIGPLVTTPDSCALLIGVDGNFQELPPTLGDTTGPCTLSRQSATLTFWDTSAGGAHADSLIWYENNHIPVPAQAPQSIVYRIPLNAPMTPVNLTGQCIDGDSDTLTYTSTSTLPTGLSISNNVLSGTATSQGASILTFRCTDIAGDWSEYE
jgi:hypothetical protein